MTFSVSRASTARDTPNLLNLHYHWRFVQLMRAIMAEGRDVVLPASQYFFQQTRLVHSLPAPIWITGLIAFVFSPRLKIYRALGWSYLVCYTVFFVLHGKNYCLAPIYPMLLTAGAVMIENAIDRPPLTWMKPAIVVLLLAGGAYFAAVVVPVLSPYRFITYMKYLPMKLPVMEHSHARAVCHSGTPTSSAGKILAETAQAWNCPPERRDCGIFSQDHGQAGAIDFLGRRYAAPALSSHQTYFLWGQEDIRAIP